MNQIEEAASAGKRVHFIGIGGVMMSALALELARRGAAVTGNDRDSSERTAMLGEHGIPVRIGHLPEYVEGADIIVRNAAIHDSSPDMLRARELGIPVLERPQVLGMLMSEYRKSIGVSGTHGKSTTSAMLTHALRECGADPTAFLGADLPEIGGSFVLGHKDFFVAESCEYCESFLCLHPTEAVILNVEPDHLDYYSGIGAIKTAFRNFAENTPESGTVIWNADSINTAEALRGIDRRTVSFGIDSGDIRAEDLTEKLGVYSFTLARGEEKLCRVELSIPGKHNVYNALACAAVLLGEGYDPGRISASISDFHGVLRRFQHRGEFNGADIIDDYAHHPDELRATLTAARALGKQRVVCLFQPHTYSRTAALRDEFVSALRLADVAVLTDIYSARETNTYGISSADIAALVPGSVYAPSRGDAEKELRSILRRGDVAVICGAGNVCTVADALVKQQ